MKSISSIADIYLGGTPKTSIPQYWKGDIKWASAKDVVNSKYRYIRNTEKTITSEGVENSAAKVLPKDTIVITARGTVGKVCLLPEDMAFNQTCYGLVAKEGITPTFLYYSLINQINQINQLSYGTVFDTITMKTFNELTIWVPENVTQNNITEILSKIDDKIEVNASINTALEELGSTLFKRWFVDFEFPDENGDPYRSSGGAMKNSELGEIPEKWNIKDLDFFGEIAGGSTPSTKNEEYWNGDIPWITPKDLSNFKNGQIFIGKGERSTTQKALDENSLRWFSKDSIIYSSRAPIGYIAIAENDLTCNQGFKNIIPYREFYREFLFYLMKEITNRIISIAGGSTFKEISGTFLKQMKVIIPPDDIIKKFHETTQSIFEYNKISVKSNEQLSELRDLLLPRLMSGEIRVPLEDG